MSNVTQGLYGAINVTRQVTKTETKSISVGAVVKDTKTGERLEFVGTVKGKRFDCPYVFVALDARPSDGNARRHSAAYVEKYLVA